MRSETNQIKVADQERSKHHKEKRRDRSEGIDQGKKKGSKKKARQNVSVKSTIWHLKLFAQSAKLCDLFSCRTVFTRCTRTAWILTSCGQGHI